MLKTFALVLVAVLIGGTGHVMLSKGMKTVGDLTEASSSRLGPMIARAVTSPWVLLGVTLQAGFFFLYLTLLSRAEVSQLLPMTAIDYIVVALLAQWLLAEAVTPVRWAGIAFVAVGVLLITRS
jgi:drug/metabolite transporter (DMT)-like permease